MTVYLGTPALDQIRSAQATVDEHVTHAPSGMCAACRTEPPCRAMRRAVATLANYGLLPKRRPGATRPDLTARPTPFTWLPRQG